MNHLIALTAEPLFNGTIGDFAEQLGRNLAQLFVSALPVVIAFLLWERYGRKKSSRTKS